MSHFVINFRSVLHRIFLILVVLVFSGSILVAQSKYRTFNQNDLNEKKSKAGKVIGAKASFRFINRTGVTVQSLHVKFNAPVIALDDSGGLVLAISEKGKTLDAAGAILPGDTIKIR